MLRLFGSMMVQCMVPAGMKSPVKQTEPAKRAPLGQLYVVLGVAATGAPARTQVAPESTPAKGSQL